MDGGSTWECINDDPFSGPVSYTHLGYAAHRDDILLAGKTGTAEIKASKEDTSGTELGLSLIHI